MIVLNAVLDNAFFGVLAQQRENNNNPKSPTLVPMQTLRVQHIFADRRPISHPHFKLTDCRKIGIHHNFLRSQAYSMRAERMHSKYKGRYAHTYDILVNILSHDHWHHLNVLTFTDQAECRMTRKKIGRTTQRSQ